MVKMTSWVAGPRK